LFLLKYDRRDRDLQTLQGDCWFCCIGGIVDVTITA